MPLYFAYGSNMDRATMAGHCPGARALGVARLEQHRFFIAAAGYASVARRAGEVVHGVLWEVAERELAALDAYEDVAGRLYRRAKLSVRHGNRLVPALVYLARDARPGRPGPGYLEFLVLRPAREWRLSRAYCDELAGWAGGA